MADIIKLIKKQSEQRISELRELGAKLSEQLKHVINLIPENTRQKSVEDFLNDIRKNVLGEAPGRSPRRAKRVSAPKRGRKAAKTAGKRGRKKKEASPSVEAEGRQV
ncbi:MAG: hypothetical protein M0033_13990 [Nitrospiraceae bacterium]|nr:hypothetical protein [Nitrospiraceae bacterium]